MSCRVAVVGASGYTGAELLRLLSGHPRAELVGVFADRRAGEKLKDVVPSFAHTDWVLETADAKDIAGRADVIMSALPHGVGAPLIAELAEARVVIDLSADFRLHKPELYQKWYGHPHPAPKLLERAVYGLPEFFRNDILNASLIACPGCYPTATALAIAPLLAERLVEPEGLIVDAKSGTSGGGRAASADFHHPEMAESIRAYKVAGTHRHTPEMEQALSEAAGQRVRLTFTPNLVPMTRGILACVYARPTDPDAAVTTYVEALERAYGYEPFLTVLKDRLPDTAHVRGSNRAHVTARYDAHAGIVVAICAIDNLVKGAAGQALQCLNLVQGYPETEGLEAAPLFP
jgi:N-acetyl-gamma-glutamyl-phosphate reductase